MLVDSVLGLVGGYVCMAIGVYEVLGLVKQASSLFYRCCIRQVVDFKKYGQWVVVTGATDGIGRAYCEQMAAKGMNIFLISRTEEKLAALARELSDKHGVKADFMAVDFSQVSKDTFATIRQKLDGLDVAILINNVGASYEHYEYLHIITDETVDNLIEINVRATAQMTRCVLPGMVQRKRGVVICIGSGVGSLLPATPLLSVYAATKAFVEQFVKSCNVEYSKFNIQFQDQAPLFVATKMSKIRRASMSIPSPSTWVASAMSSIGIDVVTAGYWYHSVMWLFMQRVPTFILENFVTRQAEGMRLRALAKKAKAGKKET